MAISSHDMAVAQNWRIDAADDQLGVIERVTIDAVAR